MHIHASLSQLRSATEMERAGLQRLLSQYIESACAQVTAPGHGAMKSLKSIPTGQTKFDAHEPILKPQ